MAKQIYNFEVFANRKDQLRRIRRKQRRREWERRIFLIVLALFVVLVLYMLNNSRCEYYIYKEETETENNANVRYEEFADGYIKYSENGIEYQKNFGVAEWNIPLSVKNPFLIKAEPYVLLADKGGNTLWLFDKKGKTGEITVRYPVVQADVSDQGIVEVILQGAGSSYIQVYDKEGTLIADMKSSVDETGYPVTAAISPDGARLAVSYYSVEGMTTKSTVAFYDFSQQLRTDDVSLMGGFDYEDTIIARLKFMDDNTVAAFGDTTTYYYNIAREPQVKKEEVFDQEIQSIFFGKGYIGYVLDNSENADEGRYRLCLYNQSGAKKLDMSLDMNYETITMKKKEIIAVRDNELTIINTGGKILFQGKLDGSFIEEVIPVGGWRTYQIVFRDKIAKMQLRFWGEDGQDEKNETDQENIQEESQ